MNTYPVAESRRARGIIIVFVHAMGVCVPPYDHSRPLWEAVWNHGRMTRMLLQVWHVERPTLFDKSYRGRFRDDWRPCDIMLPGFDAILRRGDTVIGYGECGLLLACRSEKTECEEVSRLLAWSVAQWHHTPLGAQTVLARRRADWRDEAVDLTILVCSQTLLDLAMQTLSRPLSWFRAHRYLRRARHWVRLAHLLRMEYPDPRLDFALSRHADVVSDIAARGGIPSSVGWSFLVSQTPRGFA